MKKVFIPIFLAIVLIVPAAISGCYEDGQISISVTEEVITEEKDFIDFSELDIGSAFEVEITRSDSYSVVISAAESLFDYIEVAKSGQKLKIYLNPRHIFTDFTIGAKPLKAEITMPALRELELSGASSGTITGFRSANDLDLLVSGASTLKIINCTTSDADFEISGASRVSGNVTAENMRVEVSGASKFELTGSAEEIDLEVGGASRADMEDFILQYASVDVSGASEATLTVKGKVDIWLSGASRLYFYGNPEMGVLDVSGASTIKHK
ncbi:head GIN domain-containing protein [Chloroflexota bacterium]